MGSIGCGDCQLEAVKEWEVASLASNGWETASFREIGMGGRGSQLRE